MTLVLPVGKSLKYQRQMLNLRGSASNPSSVEISIDNIIPGKYAHCQDSPPAPAAAHRDTAYISVCHLRSASRTLCASPSVAAEQARFSKQTIERTPNCKRLTLETQGVHLCPADPCLHFLWVQRGTERKSCVQLTQQLRHQQIGYCDQQLHSQILCIHACTPSLALSYCSCRASCSA